MKNFLSVVALLTVLSIVPCTFSWDLKGDYSEVGVYKVYNIKNNITLKCVADEIVDVIWYKEDYNVTDVNELENRFEIKVEIDKEEKTTTSVFTVPTSNPDDSGRYSCRVLGEIENENDDKVQEFLVAAQMAIKSPSDVEVVEGETAKIVCRVVGYRATVEWLLPETANLSRISYEHDIEVEGDQGNILVIEDSDRIIDRAHYVCQAYSADEFFFETISHGQKLTASTFLRVKDKYAYLYPLTGIIIVIVLFLLIVVISEHHRKKIEAENEDETSTFEDNVPQKKGGSVRQRKQ